MANAFNTLLIGPRNDMVQNQVYALPARLVYLTANAVLEVSATSGGGFAALATSTTGAFVSTGFVRCTTAAAVARVKA